MASFLKELGNTTADLLSNSDFINRSVGMANSYEDIMFIVQALGREPISLLGKDYLYIFDHVRRNYNMGTNVMDYNSNECPKFTFYKEKPTVRFANPYDDPKNLLDRWILDVDFESTSQKNVLFSYAESDDDYTNNKEIGAAYDIDNANPGINFGAISSFSNALQTCDMIKKTNDNFNHGKYKTLIARFHTNSIDSKDKDNITQTAISEQYGMSHGRNLLKYNKTVENGYDNPYCRVWTYHHQYNQLARAIRPFGEADSEETLESMEQSGDYNTVGFRTVENKDFGFKGGSARLDKYGVLNYRNGLVNIAPTAKIKDYFEHKENDEKAISTKKCMFSIENLAWKADNIKMDEYDQFGLSPEQKGPLGGRIMWFPPYDLTFSEDVRVNWNSNQFIGRGEKVYTYTDTERTGNLSFTLLIDHPSILDYWTGHERNGMENRGVKLTPGNGGGVDNINNQENTLLRFFAGCEILSAKPQEFRTRNLKPEVTPDPPTPPVKDPPESEVHKPPTHKAIHCVLYYPNNYSGVDDNGGTVNAIHYLMNGIGAQKYVDSSKNAVDIPTTIDTQVSIQGLGSIGGYELGRSTTVVGGISVAFAPLNADYGQIKSTYSDLETNERKAQYLTGPAGVIEGQTEGYVAEYGEKSYPLAKIIGSKAMSLGAAKDQNGKVSPNLTGATHQWYRRRWYYRVDKKYENQELSEPESYLDVRDYGLNSKKGYNSVKEDESIAKAFGLNETDENVRLISFADMFAALEGEKAEQLLSGQTVSSNVEIIKALINKENKERFNITAVKFEGHASYQGYAAFNDTLSRNRALTFKKWMQDKGFPNIDIATSDTKKESPKNNVDKGDNSDLAVKLWRSASVIIEYDESEIENASVSESTKVDYEKNDDGSLKLDEQGNPIPLKDEKTGQLINRIDKTEISNGLSSIKVNTAKDWLEQTEEGKKFRAQYEADRLKNMKIVNGKPIFDRPEIDSWTFTMQTANKYGDKNYTDTNSWDFDPSYLGEQTNIASISKGIVERYDNEGEFFELLEKNDPFMHHLITDKIKYFDPAYHSISPEGFNARLTFLHQCTRQGSTVGGADNQLQGSAYNLAFGRPPVCVLRLGDFYYTKIVINSISIQYETPQWDLNPEGIGVMPMFAKVSLNFVFLGGSDLAGPISRLQNAVSFNYYANTGVYDNRAEMVQYDSDGNGREVKFKPYSYPDMIHTNGTPREISGNTEVNK